tara:strand:+ start:3232 stop:4449 length:1218 start_codon:yes stop_codon:yes gene_type:complete
MYILLIILLGYLIYYKFISLIAKEQSEESYQNYQKISEKNTFIKMSTPKNMRKFSLISDEINTIPYFIANSLRLFNGNVLFDVITKTSSLLETSNIESVNTNTYDFGICTEYALLKLNQSKQLEKYKNTKVVCSFNKSYLFLIVRDNSKINSIVNLVGKIVGINSTKSESYSILNELCEILGFTLINITEKNVEDSETKTIYFKTDEINVLFTDFYNNTVQCLFVVSSHNLPYLFSLTDRLPVRFLDIIEPELDQFNKHTSNEYFFLTRERINIDSYNTLNSSRYLDTFYTKNVLICNSEIPDEQIYNITKNVFDNIDVIKNFLIQQGRNYFDERYDPFYHDFKREYMVYNNYKLNIHDGALQYYEEINMFTQEDNLCRFNNAMCNVYPFEKIKSKTKTLHSIFN